nr:MAG TPA: hypothetical protein [Caudoviricetes sp.]
MYFTNWRFGRGKIVLSKRARQNKALTEQFRRGYFLCKKQRR